MSAVLLAASFGAASAQDARGILAPGNAAVTGFSGTKAPAAAPNTNPADLTEIDLAGPSVRIVDLQTMGGPTQAQLVPAPKPFTATAAQLGQVFAVALDDAAAPNIYVAATSAYGLPIVAPGPGGGLVRARQGAPGASFMPGLFGPANLAGGPGSIWRIDGVTGEVRLFANVTLEGAPNPGPALGGLAFDKASHMLFVADRGTGMIHAFDPNSQERGRYDHGTQGRVAAGLPPVAYDPARRLDITNASFKTDDPSSWGFAADERRVFGLGVRAGRLFYAVAGEQVWSVSIMPDGSFGNDARVDVQVPPWDGETEISKITFDDKGAMLLAERAAPTGAYDFAALAKEAVGRVLRYQQVAPAEAAQPPMPTPGQPQPMPANQPGQPAQDAASLWQPVPDEYAIGFPADLRNDNGGVAIGYSYTPAGTIDRNTCGGFLWSTGERLRETADQALAARLAAGGPAIVNGLQGNALDVVRPANVPPLATYFVDYNDTFDDAAARGHMGDIAILRVCGQGGGMQVVPVMEAGGGLLIGGFCQLNQIRLPNGECCERRHVRQGRCEGCPPDQIRLPNGQCCPREYTREGRCDQCPPGTIRLPNGQCCPRELYRDGECRPCPPGTIRLPNGQCCPRESIRDGRCDPCPPGSIQLPNGQCCPRQYVHNGQCCPPTYVAPGCEPPCPRGEIRLPNGQCCPPDKVYNGACYHPVPRVNVLPHCPRGTIRLGDGSCGHERPIVRIPGRLHIDKPPHHRPEKPQKTPKRERTVTPNWKPTGGTTRLNTFHPQIQGGGGMGGGGTHRGR
jgi:hypothetical protein